MPWQLAVSTGDYFLQLGALLRDPVYRGTHVQVGTGEPVLLIPGFLGGDWTMVVMAGWLNRIGYRAYFSGIDWNIDCPNRTGERLQWRLDHILKREGTPLIVIGHSLGGMLARFLGGNFPEKIRHVIALGSPIHRPMRVHPLVHSAFLLLQPLRRLKGRTAPQCGSLHCTCSFSQTVFSPLPPGVGFTSIFSKNDEVVDWRASFDPLGDNQEVSGRHVGLIVNPQVYQILARTLARYSQHQEVGVHAFPPEGPLRNGFDARAKAAW
ncbi:MAG: alpha/beta fold hydrolase [Thermodesulfobacteriota bacterium]|jgi:pimeloyl-ACP methyl ester carboxylesterase